MKNRKKDSARWDKVLCIYTQTYIKSVNIVVVNITVNSFQQVFTGYYYV